MTTFSFEQAYQRLEQILQKLSAGEVDLEESLKLYEEADKLIAMASQKLTAAEQKIQMLVKNRNGAVSVGQDNRPQMETFSH